MRHYPAHVTNFPSLDAVCNISTELTPSWMCVDSCHRCLSSFCLWKRPSRCRSVGGGQTPSSGTVEDTLSIPLCNKCYPSPKPLPPAVHVCVCTSVFAYVHACVHVVCVYVHKCVCLCVFAYVHACVCIFTYACAPWCVCVCTP